MIKCIIIKMLMGLLLIPTNYLVASKLSQIVKYAEAGNVEAIIYDIIWIILLIVVLRVVCIFLQTTFNNVKTVCLNQRRNKIYEDILHTPLYKLKKFDKGDIKEVLTGDFDTIANMQLEILPKTAIAIILVAFYFCKIIEIDTLVAVFLGAFSVTQILPPVIWKKYLAGNYEDNAELEGRMTESFVENVAGFLEIKTKGIKQWRLSKIDKLNAEYVKVGAKTIVYAEFEIVLRRLVENIIKYISYAALGIFALKNRISLAEVVFIVALLPDFYAGVSDMYAFISKYEVYKKARKRTSKYGKHHENLKQFNITGKEINLTNIICKMNNGKIIEYEKSIKFCAPNTYLIKGKNGSGKTTLLNIIAGLQDDYTGDVVVDGNQIRDCMFCNDPHACVYIDQIDLNVGERAIDLFEMTKGFDLQTFKETAYSFGVIKDDIIDKKMNELSGGERKKLLLSFAFSMNPLVLILDEPTNYLDENGKVELIRKLKERDKLTIIVSHDKELLSVADKVYEVTV